MNIGIESYRNLGLKHNWSDQLIYLLDIERRNAGMHLDNTTVQNLIIMGFEIKEIALRFNVSCSAISKRIATIKKHLIQEDYCDNLSLLPIENTHNSTERRRRAAAKLSPEDVSEIRKLLSDRIPASKIAPRFKVTETTIYRIKYGETFSNG